MDNRFSNGTSQYILLYIILLHFWQKQFNWESGLTETVRLAFHEKTADYYTKQIYEWKQLWLKGNTPKYINPAVWLELQEHWADQATIEKSIKNRTRKQSQGVDLASREQSKQNRETMKLREFSILT